MEYNYPEEINRYNKRVEDLLEDAEIEAELEAENKVRSKNARLFLISILGMGLLLFIYFGVDMPFQKQEPPIAEETQIAHNPAEPKPILFLNPKESTTVSSETQIKETPAPPAKNIFSPTKNPVKEREIIPRQTAQKVFKTPEVMNVAKPEPIPKAIPPKMKITRAKVRTSVKKIAVKVGLKSDSKPSRKPVTQKSDQPELQKGYWVQVGAFSLKSNADEFAKTLKTKGLNPSIQSRPTKRLMNIVFVGDYKDKKTAREPFKELKQAGFEPYLKENGKNSYTFVLGKFKTENQAVKLQDQLSLKGFLPGVKRSKVEATNYVVQLGTFRTKEEAQSKQEKIEQLGYKKAFIRFMG